jgi:hypothetical protein
LEPVTVAAEVQRPDLLTGFADQIAFAEKDLLSAVELDVLTTFAPKRYPKLIPRCELFILGLSSRRECRVSAG